MHPWPSYGIHSGTMSNQLTVTIDTNSRGELVARDPEGNAVAIRSSTCNPAALAQLIRAVEIAGHLIDWAESQVAKPDADHDGTPWAEYEYDHDRAKREVRNWETVATYGSTFPDGDGVGACDVRVQVGEHGGHWYLRTRDDAGGADEYDATPYADKTAADKTAKDLAADRDECDGLSAEAWLEREAEAAVEAAKDQGGEYVLIHADGSRWDSDRYRDPDGAQLAVDRWYEQVQAANPGADIIWHLMDCPQVGRITDDGSIATIDRDDA